MAVDSISLESKEVAKGQKLNPVSVGWVKRENGELLVSCLRCSYTETISFEGLHDHEIVIDLPRRRGWQMSETKMQVH